MLATIITLILLGMVMLGVEFVLPGAIIGVLGVGALIAATVLAFAEYGPGPGFATAVGVIIIVIVFVALWVKYFHRTYFGKKLTLTSEIGGSEIHHQHAGLLGKTGVAACDLHPTGKALIDGRKVDVVAEVGLIEKDQPVTVVKVEGIRVVVRETQGATGFEGPRP